MMLVLLARHRSTPPRIGRVTGRRRPAVTLPQRERYRQRRLMYVPSAARRLFPLRSILLAVLALSPSHATLVSAQQTAAATLSFVDVTDAVGMSSSNTGSHGAFWADATGDGLPDLFLSYNECRSGE